MDRIQRGSFSVSSAPFPLVLLRSGSLCRSDQFMGDPGYAGGHYSGLSGYSDGGPMASSCGWACGSVPVVFKKLSDSGGPFGKASSYLPRQAFLVSNVPFCGLIDPCFCLPVPLAQRQSAPKQQQDERPSSKGTAGGDAAPLLLWCRSPFTVYPAALALPSDPGHVPVGWTGRLCCDRIQGQGDPCRYRVF